MTEDEADKGQQEPGSYEKHWIDQSIKQQSSQLHNVAYSIEKATKNDIERILQLVNTAYRSENAKQYGWTSEVDMLDGSRVDEDAINESLDNPNAIILQYFISDYDNMRNNENDEVDILSSATSKKTKLVGCVELVVQQLNNHDDDKNCNKLYLGMLSVLPQYQSNGIGKQLLASSESYGRSIGCTVMRITVLSIRIDLLQWYQKHGYKQTNEPNIPYKIPDDYRWGIPKLQQPLEFVILEKQIHQGL
jgi:GNAT superfamily N-acetyltransferase